MAGQHLRVDRIAGCRGSLFRGLLGGLAEHQGLGLGEAVGQQLGVKFRIVVRRRAHQDEFDRDHVGALVQHLEIGMLAIGAGLAPDHRTGRERQRFASEVDALAVALHLELLQIGR